MLVVYLLPLSSKVTLLTLWTGILETVFPRLLCPFASSANWQQQRGMGGGRNRVASFLFTARSVSLLPSTGDSSSKQ